MTDVPLPSSWSLSRRYWRVMLFAGRTALSVVWWDILLRRIGLRRWVRRTAPGRYARAARGYRQLAVSLGGLWIKVGQFLSSRLDVLPDFVTGELAGLQDEVPSEPASHMMAVIEAEFGRPVEAIFPWFEQQTLASASLGQVHRARLADGSPVVVKIQRPGIERILDVDLAALQRVVGWLKRYRPISRRADLEAMLAEFRRTLLAEVDYLAEAENARTFQAMFADDRSVRIPAVHPQQTTRRVLTLEDVYFIKITDYAAIDAAGIDRAAVADRLLGTYLRQIFLEGFFHADPHPGNLFVQPPGGEDGWRLVFVDFGMVGRLTPEAKAGMRDLVIALGTRDLDRLMRSYQTLGVLLPGADLERLRQAQQMLFDRVWGRSIRELVAMHPSEMRAFAERFRDVLYEAPFQVPADLIFLGRCVSILSGMCTGLDPEFNVFEHIAPFARGLLEEEGGDWLDQILTWLVESGRRMASLPARIDATLSDLQAGRLTVTARADPELSRSLTRLAGAINGLVAALIFVGLLLAGTALYLNGEKALGVAAAVLGVLSLVAVLRR